jgi:two-component system, OmpR family, alkaline phosphatase synthesis response regulator PhoP
MDITGKRILVVDDEEDLCEILKYNLVNEGFHTEIAHSAEEAINRPLRNFDLILLDVMMGPMSGFKFAYKLRHEMKLAVSIIFLSAKSTENDILTGYSLGADDYIAKPFSINELIVRIKALFKRSLTADSDTALPVKYGNIQIDNIKRRLIINDEAEVLTEKEYLILNLLLGNPGKLFSRKDIIRKVWGEDVIIKERTVDVNITKLRSKLGEYGSCLSNKKGFGYYFELL